MWTSQKTCQIPIVFKIYICSNVRDLAAGLVAESCQKDFKFTRVCKHSNLTPKPWAAPSDVVNSNIALSCVPWQFPIFLLKLAVLHYNPVRLFLNFYECRLWLPPLYYLQFDDIGDHGTKVIVYNLWYNDEGRMELDFEADSEVWLDYLYGISYFCLCHL